MPTLGLPCISKPWPNLQGVPSKCQACSPSGHCWAPKGALPANAWPSLRLHQALSPCSLLCGCYLRLHQALSPSSLLCGALWVLSTKHVSLKSPQVGFFMIYSLGLLGSSSTSPRCPLVSTLPILFVCVYRCVCVFVCMCIAYEN